MKRYIKPITKVTPIEAQLLSNNSVVSTSGLSGVTVSQDDFSGGSTDSRSGSIWDDED